MIKKFFSLLLATAIMLIPMAAAAEGLEHVTFQEDQISIDIPKGASYRENIKEDYEGVTEEAMRMTQIFLVYQKDVFYMNLDYIADEDGVKYDMSDEKTAMKMFEEKGSVVMRDDISSSGIASSGEMGDAEYFEADNGTGYIRVEHKADGSDKVNMITYLTCSGETCYKMFVLYGKLNKKKETYDPLSEEAIEKAEAVIGTYKDTGYDNAFLVNKEKKSIIKGALKWAFIGIIVGGMIGGLFFVGKQTRKLKRGEKSMFSPKQDDVVVQSVRDAHADRGKNPNAKKAANKKKKDKF